MNVRKSIFAVSTVAVLFGSSLMLEKAVQRTRTERQVTADGCDPMPLPYPKAASANEDKANTTAGAAVLTADGCDPMPLPYPKSAKGIA